MFEMTSDSSVVQISYAMALRRLAARVFCRHYGWYRQIQARQFDLTIDVLSSPTGTRIADVLWNEGRDMERRFMAASIADRVCYGPTFFHGK